MGVFQRKLKDSIKWRFQGYYKEIKKRIEAVFRADGATEDTRARAHAFFAALNGVLISFRNYPGRNPEAVQRHMQALGRCIARRFSSANG